MNLHPLVVHFPIALLTVYAVLEVCRLPVITRQQWWFYTKAILLIAGSIGTFAALQTGEMDAEGFRGTPTMALVQLHATFAQGTTFVFALLTAAYLIEWLQREAISQRLPETLRESWNALITLERTIFIAPILIAGAILGFLLLTVTGALGGALVYGTDTDPIVKFVTDLLYRP